MGEGIQQHEGIVRCENDGIEYCPWSRPKGPIGRLSAILTETDPHNNRTVRFSN